MSSDLNNFSSSHSHRLPTVSASAALKKLSGSGNLAISTGLKLLDQLLGSTDVGNGGGGLLRGQVTEVYGPPGVGKTTLAMQAASNALHAGAEVLWIDTATPLPGPRFTQILAHPPPPNTAPQGPPSSPPVPTPSPKELLKRFHYVYTPTLPHLLALLSHLSSPGTTPAALSLLVIDSITTLFASAFPRLHPTLSSSYPSFPSTSTAYPNPSKPPSALSFATSRRFAIQADVLARLAKLAATRDPAVLVLSQMTTRIERGEGGAKEAVLRPGVGARGWEGGVGGRVGLWRDWGGEVMGREGKGREGKAARFAGVVKSGAVVWDGVGRCVGFAIETGGLREIVVSPAAGADRGSVGALSVAVEVVEGGAVTLPVVFGLGLKRKREREEVADSQSEAEEEEEEEAGSAGEDEFGWMGGEELGLEDLEGVDGG